MSPDSDKPGAIPMDFSKLGRPVDQRKPINPIEIFEALPNLPSTPNDLWRGQTEALNLWHQSRDTNDTLIELNTGAGKTLVGLLLAQSLVNEGVQNVIYACATIDLVSQTSKEALSLGIQHSLRVRSSYNNDLFESGNGFCITTYHALLNGLSSIRKRYFPEAIIFDDAHVSENLIRDSLTLSFSNTSHPDLFLAVSNLFEPDFVDLERRGEFRNAVEGIQPKIVMTSPNAVVARYQQLSHIFDTHGAEQDNKLKYSFAHLRDRLDRCAVFFGRGECQITPPFIPALSLDYFSSNVRRVYLSATMTYKSSFVRAFGREPGKIISPQNDAGNGERVILNNREFVEAVDAAMVMRIADDYKVVVAVPNYSAAQKWKPLAEPPKQQDFSKQLEVFRRADSGAFILVHRVDGIDLPHEICRVMVIDSIPSSGSLLDRFQWGYLNMKNVCSATVANRLTQLFGRINRGRNDYGVFLLVGRDLSIWIRNARNRILLPELLQQQLTIGEEVQTKMGIRNGDTLQQLISTVLGRDQSWLKYYGENIGRERKETAEKHRAEETNARMTGAALAEAEYARMSWDGDYSGACKALDKAIEQTARADSLLAGWHNVWQAACYQRLGDIESAAHAYGRARNRLLSNIYLPTLVADRATTPELPLNRFGTFLDSLASLTSEESYRARKARVSEALAPLAGGHSSGETEAAVRELGEFLGFESKRPDNDSQAGPDVLWVDEDLALLLPIELKTDKKQQSILRKKDDIGQGFDNINWIAKNYSEYGGRRLLFVTDAGFVSRNANPSEDMYLVSLSTINELANKLLAVIRDLRNELTLLRPKVIREISSNDDWSHPLIIDRLCVRRISDLDPR